MRNPLSFQARGRHIRTGVDVTEVENPAVQDGGTVHGGVAQVVVQGPELDQAQVVVRGLEVAQARVVVQDPEVAQARVVVQDRGVALELEPALVGVSSLSSQETLQLVKRGQRSPRTLTSQPLVKQSIIIFAFNRPVH